MTYRLICDSCTDLPSELGADPHVKKVPLTIQIGPETVVDGEDFRQGELLQKMRAWPDAPKTACPAPSTYLEQFLEDGDSYVITLSGVLSGSYNAAMQARAIYQEEGGRGNVHVFNSCSASAGETHIALALSKLASSGMPFGEVVAEMDRRIAQMNTLFVLENLDVLRKAGRLTRVQSLVTGALRVKLLCGATPEGEIQKLGQGLTVRQTLAKMVGRMAEDPDHVERRLVIAHCNCLERAFQVKAMVEAKCKFAHILITEAGGITSVYAYDGGIVVAY